ncbi:ATP-binding protein [Phytoactinopolyspora limicola]|uniref:ATP-binding protein n=1 Tax=Phytoactinopolyspora limicola TaxID=2715536 RepID=UPI00140DE387|nr:LuxR family transcriptional regulator [Phytoactinopolyspora limicola]
MVTTPVYPVHPVHQPGPVRPAYPTPLVGREDELSDLVYALRHPPALAVIDGEAGVGKSRLIHDALHEAGPGVRGPCLVTRCLPTRSPLPYGPVLDVARRLTIPRPERLNPVCGALHPYLPELAAILPAPVPTALGSGGECHRLFRALRELLAASGAAVLVIEDLHWADSDTVDLIRFLAADLPGTLSLVLTRRRDVPHPPGVPLGRTLRPGPDTAHVVLSLGPLDAGETGALAAAEFGVPGLATPVAHAIHAHTGGIPYLVEQVVRSLPAPPPPVPASPVPGTSDPRWDLPVPVALRDWAAERLTMLDEAAAHVVRAAAVLESAVSEDLLGAVAGSAAEPGGVAMALRTALTAGLLHEAGEGRYTFRHGVARKAVYDAIPGPDRRALHQRALKHLVRQHPQEWLRLAHHAERSADAPAWSRYVAAAAAEGVASGDARLLADLVERVLATADAAREVRGDLACTLGRVAVAGLEHERAITILRAAVDRHRLPAAVRGEIRVYLGLLLSQQASDVSAGRAELERAVDELDDRPALAARAMAALALPGRSGVSLSQDQQWVARAQRLVASARYRPAGEAAPLVVEGSALAVRMATGDPDVWPDVERLLAKQGTPDGQPTPDDQRAAAWIYCELADSASWSGHDEAARRLSTLAGQIAAEHSAPYYAAVATAAQLRADWLAGQWHGLADRARDLLAGHAGVARVAAEAHLVLGSLAVTQGAWAEAEAHLDAAGLDEAGATATPVIAAAAATRARLRMGRGDIDAAVAEIHAAMDIIERKQVWPWAAELAPTAVNILIRAGATRDAQRIAADLAGGTAGQDTPLVAAALHMCRGAFAAAAAEPASAAAAFGRAEVAYAALPRPYPALRAAESAARCRLDNGDPSATTELLDLVERFTELGAARDAGRCRQTLRAAGVVIASPKGRRGYGDQLSPREGDVARLLALGQTNREIAEALFLSPRTVEQHVARVLRKLGLRSRTEVTSTP